MKKLQALAAEINTEGAKDLLAAVIQAKSRTMHDNISLLDELHETYFEAEAGEEKTQKFVQSCFDKIISQDITNLKLAMGKMLAGEPKNVKSLRAEIEARKKAYEKLLEKSIITRERGNIIALFLGKCSKAINDVADYTPYDQKLETKIEPNAGIIDINRTGCLFLFKHQNAVQFLKQQGVYVVKQNDTNLLIYGKTKILLEANTGIKIQARKI